MKNEILSIGPFTIYGYGLMIGIGVVAAYLSAEYRAKKLKLDPEMILGLVIWCLGFGYLGSKILYCLTVIDQIIADPSFIIHSIQNGWVVYGGLIGGMIGGLLYARYKKINFMPYFDLGMPSVALAQAFGRIGCFWAGCCYGKETSCAIGFTYTQSDYAPVGVSLIPTQLISSALDFLNFLVLVWLSKRKKAEGQVAGWYLIFYSIGRFVLEYFRGDMERGSIGELSTSQFIAVFTLILGIVIVIGSGRLAKKGVKAFVTGENGTALNGGVLAPAAADDSAETAEEEQQAEESGEQPQTETEQNQ